MSIIIENVNHTYMLGSENAHMALKNISLTIGEGEYWGLIGHTGSGKSTLVQLIGGLLQPTAGSITVDGLDMADKKQRVKARGAIGLVFQYPEYQLFEETVAKDIAYGPRNLHLDEEEIAGRVEEAMQLVGLPESYKEKSPFELSGGEKRRAALAGILAMRPKYLVLDEPMAGLDPSGRADILATIAGLRDRTGCAVVMVSHSMDDMARCAERLAVLKDGELIRVGAPGSIFGDPALLTGIGLDIPQITKLCLALKERGIETPNLYDIEDMSEYLLGRIRPNV